MSAADMAAAGSTLVWASAITGVTTNTADKKGTLLISLITVSFQIRRMVAQLNRRLRNAARFRFHHHFVTLKIEIAPRERSYCQGVAGILCRRKLYTLWNYADRCVFLAVPKVLQTKLTPK